MSKMFSVRSVFLLGFIAICVLLGGAVYLQYVDNISPCPLCILQRFTLIVLGFIFFFGAALKLKSIGKVLVSLMAIFISLLGVILAGRQVWLQHLPPSAGETCGTSITYMLKVLPLTEVISKVLQGGSECSLVGWQFWGLSLAEWSLMSFIGFLIIAVWQLVRKPTR